MWQHMATFIAIFIVKYATYFLYSYLVDFMFNAVLNNINTYLFEGNPCKLLVPY
jgi:hypothetical protein